MTVKIGKAISDKEAKNRAVMIFHHVVIMNRCETCNVITPYLPQPKDLAGPQQRKDRVVVECGQGLKGQYMCPECGQMKVTS